MADIKTLHAMRRQAEVWLAERGIEQWGQGFLTGDELADQITRREWFVALSGSDVVAALRYLDMDEDVWPDQSADEARYVHGLMVNRAVAPKGAGTWLLAWAERRAQSEGARWMRLDCVESNARLRRLYVENGHREVGRRDFDGPWFSATLLEKTLDASQPEAGTLRV